MKSRILSLGVALGLTTVLLRMMEYRLLWVDHSLELYIGLVAVVFAVVGMVVGRKLWKKEIIIEKLVHVPDPVVYRENVETNAGAAEKLGISKREFEVLELMAQGYSNQEIADRVFLSIHTVKTHASNLFTKLDVQRRTQAVKKAKELDLIP